MAEEKPTTPTTLRVTMGSSPGTTETSLARRKVIVIGRDADCDLVIHDAKASRRHCKLTRGEGVFILEDLGAKNGTLVDGERINAPISLKTGQAFKVGDTVFYLT